MSLLGRSFVGDTSFTPLFHLLDDFSNYQHNNQYHRRGGVMRSFNPKFDVKENIDSYELHGELPGIEQKDINIEFTDLQTITVKGRTEHTFASGTPPAAVGDSKIAGTITEGTAEQTPSHKATVEDEGAEATSAPAGTPKTENADLVKTGESKAQESKYWVSERNVGEFSRSFTFPVRVDQDAVKASMKNGILSIVVPKAKKQEARKIAIN